MVGLTPNLKKGPKSKFDEKNVEIFGIFIIKVSRKKDYFSI